ncbi:MAG TPA: NAD(P)H-hydrate dehydratase [Nitrospirota bacterium]|nr:NAD(P)H-hydrate dehydratase [Nitrospirota bacterium]
MDVRTEPGAGKSMKIVTAQQMKNIDRRAIKEFGIPGPVLMENAASAILDEMEKYFGGLAGVRTGIICGKGNNGGDGLTLARRLRIRGVPVRVALLSPFNDVTGEAKINLSILRKMDVEIQQAASLRSVAQLISWSDVLVDAMLGVGLASSLKGVYAQAVNIVNASGKPVVSVDIPTGIDSDTGAVLGTAIKADLTVTMALLKRGLVLYPGADHAGTVRVADIGIPPEIVERENLFVSLLDRSVASVASMRRKTDAHKGDFGHLMIIAGSPGKAGAAVMVAKSSLRTGPGLVSVATPNSLVPIIQSQIFEAMCIPAAESMEGTLGIASEEELLRSADKMSAVAIGPGLSTHFESAQVVRNLIPRIKIPLVIDADGLNALVGHKALLKDAKAPVILTPHPGEMGRLLSLSAADVQKDRINIAARFAKDYNVVLVLKGAGTVIATPQGEIFINSSGNPGMATGGTGDVLTGMIGGFLAQGRPAVQAACLSVYLHGLAGDIAARELGEASLIAGDVIEKIPHAMKEMEKNGGNAAPAHG